MAPVIVKNKFKRLAIPIDSGKNIFGKNKTWRGLLFGVLFAVIIAYLQFLLYRSYRSDFGADFFRDLSLIDYSNWLLIGFLLGSGALLGDMTESFIKRRLSIQPGERLIPWDQLDFVIGALVFISPIADLTLKMIMAIFVISVLGHILVNHSAYYLGIRKEKW